MPSGVQILIRYTSAGASRSRTTASRRATASGSHVRPAGRRGSVRTSSVASRSVARRASAIDSSRAASRLAHTLPGEEQHDGDQVGEDEPPDDPADRGRYRPRTVHRPVDERDPLASGTDGLRGLHHRCPVVRGDLLHRSSLPGVPRRHDGICRVPTDHPVSPTKVVVPPSRQMRKGGRGTTTPSGDRRSSSCHLSAPIRASGHGWAGPGPGRSGDGARQSRGWVDPWTRRGSGRVVEPTRGLEPLTARLQVGCATSCATSAGQASRPRDKDRDSPRRGCAVPGRLTAPVGGTSRSADERCVRQTTGVIRADHHGDVLDGPDLRRRGQPQCRRQDARRQGLPVRELARRSSRRPWP